MTLRVSTAGFHAASINEMLAHQARLSRTQTQLASGQRVNSPADDPIAATRILDIERSRAQLEQYDRNAAYAANRLGVTEQAMSDLTGLLQRVHQLTVQAGSSALDDASLASIAAELRTRAQELHDLANRRDSGGEFLFAGFSTQTQPFSRSPAGVTYSGDDGVRSLQVSASQRVGDGLSGARVFMGIAQGNGSFVTGLGSHTGAGRIDVGVVADPVAWQAAPEPREYTIRFVTESTWEVLDANGDPLLEGGVPVTGSYVEGAGITFHGARVAVSGDPAAGDTFTIAPAGRESLFDTVDKLIGALETGWDNPEARARFNVATDQALAQIAKELDHVYNLRAEVGSRLSTLDNADAMRADLAFELDATLSELRDLDYAEAVSRMNQQLVGLQAAQAAYGRIAQLSLFDYI